ncbi:MAG: 2Fe-2S iron-sulfur cluster binding domain-containing protein [Kangiellaceae bacterium]|nr:2Fe-2S iron-sulfur cluster binding domain-containing protein [Kangiellaceae bacterium]
MSTDFYSLKINSVERLTKDSIALNFSPPEGQEELFKFTQGQHLTLKADIDGQDIRRSYSICRGTDTQELRVGIKAIDNGVFSNYANTQLKAGMFLEVMPPQGHFYTELSPENKKNYLLIAVGSGITPMLSHIESILSLEQGSHITLLYGNKRTPMMMFRETLCFLKNKYMERFNWVNFFTKEENDAEILNGRISAQKIIDLDSAKLIEIKRFDDVFVCGPEKMTLDVAAAFEFWGFDKSKIHYELFFSGSAEETAEKNKAKRAEKYGEKTANVSVKVAGRKTLLELEMGGVNILDAAMENGADLPFSCKGGVCATCKAKVIRGKVEMDMNHSLTEQEVAEGMILTCQAHPVSEDVEIDFDIC